MANGGGDDRDLRARYARARAVITVVVLIGIGAALSDIGAVLEVSKEVDSYAKSVGSAILASVIVYILISWLLEPVRQRAQAADVSRFAIEVANRQFQERFEASLPRLHMKRQQYQSLSSERLLSLCWFYRRVMTIREIVPISQPLGSTPI